jgi:hypothetical protein
MLVRLHLEQMREISCGNEQHQLLPRSPGLRQEKAIESPTRMEGGGARPVYSPGSLAWPGLAEWLSRKKCEL